MSKAKARKDRTSATLAIKDRKVRKSSHGKFDSVASLERHRVEVTKKNQKKKKKEKED